MANSQYSTVTASETARYKEATTRSRFLQQIFLGLGGATVFGLVGALSSKLLTSVFVSGEILPMLGLGAIGLMGVACLYVGAKLLSNTIMMEQDYQAKKIGQVTLGKAPEVTPSIELEKRRSPTAPMAVHGQDAQAEAPATPDHAEADKPNTEIRDIAAHQKLAADAGLCRPL